jgi:hypothetical protein
MTSQKSRVPLTESDTQNPRTKSTCHCIRNFRWRLCVKALKHSDTQHKMPE